VGFDPEKPVFVARAESSVSFLGVVSTAPGIVLGGYNETLYAKDKKLPIALAGRVPVKVNLEGGLIKVGDAITISSVAGVGTKATTTTQTIGVALEPYDGTGTSSIQVFIKPELTFSLEDRLSLADLLSATSSPAASSFWSGMFIRVATWLADAGNGVVAVFARSFHAKDEICVDNQCLTRDDVRKILLMVNTAEAEETAAPEPEETPAPPPAPNSEEPAAPEETPAPAADPEPEESQVPAADPEVQEAPAPADDSAEGDVVESAQ
jgi:hypothetical protein